MIDEEETEVFPVTLIITPDVELQTELRPAQEELLSGHLLSLLSVTILIQEVADLDTVGSRLLLQIFRYKALLAYHGYAHFTDTDLGLLTL